MNDSTPGFAPTRRGLLVTATGAAAASWLGLLQGCSSSGSSGESTPGALPQRLTAHEELIIALDQSTVSAPFDPIQGWGDTGVNPFHSTLTVADKDNQIVNDLATGYTISDDKLTWTFTIRDDVTFTNGAPLTAQDVAFTYNKAKESAKVALPGFDHATATDSTTVEIHLTKPSSILLYTAAVLGIVPEAAYTSDYGDKPVGSGPWKFADYIQGQQLILERNDNYHGEKAKFAKVTILLMASDAGLAAAKAGQVDLAFTYPNFSQQVPTGFTMVSLPTFDYRVISLPCQQPGAWEVDGKAVGNAVTSDRELRRAMALGVDRKQLVDQCLLGYGDVAFDAFDAFPWGVRAEENSLTDGDVEQARQILDAAGWATGADGMRAKGDLKASFTLHYPPTDPARQALAEGFKKQMQALGIDVQLDALDFSGIKENNRINSVVLGGGKFTPYSVHNQLSSEGTREKGWLNIACCTNPTVEQNLTKALESTDTETANQHWRDALWDGETGGSILGDSPYIMCCYVRNNYFVRQGLDIGEQHLHPHDHFLHVIYNLNTWQVSS